MRRVSERHPSVQSARFIDFHATLNLVSALSSLPDAEAYPGFRDLVLDGARRGVGPVRALVSGGVPIELVERAVWHHRGLAHVNVVAEAVPRDLLKLLPLSMCRNRAVIPYHNDGESAVVAVSDPADISVFDEVRRRLGRRRVRLVVADRDNIMRVIQLLEARLASEALELVANSNGSSPVEEQDDASGQVAQLVTNLVVQGCAARASDIHIEPTAEGVRIRFRIDGVLHHIITYPKSLAAGLTNRLKVMADLDVSDRRRPHEGRFAMSTGDSTVDVRLVTFPTVWGEEGAAVRIFGGLMPVIGLDRLGMSPWVLDAYLGLCFSRHGLVLATGPAGSGKTTTLYAALDRLAAADSRVLTVEDPVEIRFPHMTQVQVNTKAGLTFATALRSFLRSDPDILLVGEIRDYETAQLSVEAALTGHLVLASMHAKSAPAAVIRLLEMGVAPNDAASALRGVCVPASGPPAVPRVPNGRPGRFRHLRSSLPPAAPAQAHLPGAGRRLRELRGQRLCGPHADGRGHVDRRQDLGGCRRLPCPARPYPAGGGGGHGADERRRPGEGDAGRDVAGGAAPGVS